MTRIYLSRSHPSDKGEHCLHVEKKLGEKKSKDTLLWYFYLNDFIPIYHSK